MRLAVVNACYQPKDEVYFEKIDSLKSAMESMARDGYRITFFCCTQARRPKVIQHNGVTYDFSTGVNVFDAIDNCARKVASCSPQGIIIEDFHNPVVQELQHLFPRVPKLLIFCGGDLNIPTIPCAAVQVASPAMGAVLKNKGYGGKIFTSAFTVDTNFFKPTPGAPQFYDAIYVADWRENKRQRLLLDAIALGGISNVCFAGAQDGIYSQDFFTYCGSFINSVRKNITLVNRVPGNAMLPYYNGSKMALHLGMSTEGGARSLMEAMSCGLPMVVLNDCLSNTSRVEPGVEGLHVAPNPRALNAAIINLMCDSRLAHKMGEAARKRAVRDWYNTKMEEDFREVFPLCGKS